MALTAVNKVLTILKRYASSRLMSLRQVLGGLVCRARHEGRSTREVSGLVVVDLPPDSPKVRQETVRRLESERP
jgi:hypothetical protein